MRKNMVICDLMASMEFQAWSFYLDPWLKQGIDLSCNDANYYPFGLKYTKGWYTVWVILKKETDTWLVHGILLEQSMLW